MQQFFLLIDLILSVTLKKYRHIHNLGENRNAMLPTSDNLSGI